MNDQNNNLIMPDARPSRADAVRNRELLLETASALFAEYGVEAVSMTQIAEAASVGKGTLYRHFNSKTELCYALLDQDQRQLQAQTLRQLNQAMSPLEKLRWFLWAVADFVYANEEVLFVAVDSARGSGLGFAAHSWWRQTIRGLLDQMDATGDREYSSDVLYVMLDVNTIHFQKRILGYDLERIRSGLCMTLDRLID